MCYIGGTAGVIGGGAAFTHPIGQPGDWSPSYTVGPSLGLAGGGGTTVGYNTCVLRWGDFMPTTRQGIISGFMNLHYN